MPSLFARVDAGIARAVSRRFLLTERHAHDREAEPQPLPIAFWSRWRALGRHTGSVTVWGTFLPDPERRPLAPSEYPALVRVGFRIERQRYFNASLIRAPRPRASVAEVEAIFVALADELDAAVKEALTRPSPED